MNNPDGWGVGWFDAGGADRRPLLPHGRRRCGTTAQFPYRGASRAARSSPPPASRRRAPRSTRAATRRSAADGWLFSLNGHVDGFPEGDRRRVARAPERGPAATRIVGRLPTPRCSSRWCSIGSSGRPARRRARVTWSRQVAGDHRRQAQPAAHRRARGSRHALRQLALRARGDDRVRAARRRPRLAGGPGRLARVGHGDPDGATHTITSL